MDKKIAFLGPNGTFAHEATLKYFSDKNEFIPVNRINDIFNEIVNNKIDFGVVPSENSVGGTIGDTLDLFVNTELKVFDQLTLKISQNLLSLTQKPKIKKIFSHPQSLMQCACYITKNFTDIECIDAFSNAKACMLAKNEVNSAAIGPRLCGKEYGLDIIEESINDSKNNETKFYIVSSKINDNLKSKSLIIFSVANKSGSLFDILKIFKQIKINMTRIESRPSKVKNWEYVFIIEYENSKDLNRNEKLINVLKKKCNYFDYLGSY
jgi:chorismate mutase / prephenate dehydratase